jgi:hypothetical protein
VTETIIRDDAHAQRIDDCETRLALAGQDIIDVVLAWDEHRLCDPATIRASAVRREVEEIRDELREAIGEWREANEALRAAVWRQP